MATDPNDQAFASDGYYHDQDTYVTPAPGLTKREYFAAMAMQGFCAAMPITIAGKVVSGSQIAQMSVESADSLILALNTIE